MADTSFYAKGKSRGNHRKVVVNNATLLIGKAPTKAKRIKMKITMGLSTQKLSGTPEWIAAAHEFVAKHHDPVSPVAEFKGMDISFATENLFNAGVSQAVKCQLRSFQIKEMGDSEEPDVVMTFAIYAPFSTDLWDYLGQMAGDDIWAKFEQSIPDPEEVDDLELSGEEDAAEDVEDDSEEDAADEE